jgi:hypothetical protein
LGEKFNNFLSKGVSFCQRKVELDLCDLAFALKERPLCDKEAEETSFSRGYLVNVLELVPNPWETEVVADL